MLLNAYLIGLVLCLVLLQITGFAKGNTTKDVLANAGVAFLWPLALPLFVLLCVWVHRAGKAPVMAVLKDWGMMP